MADQSLRYYYQVSNESSLISIDNYYAQGAACKASLSQYIVCMWEDCLPAQLFHAPRADSPIHANWDAAAARTQVILPIWQPCGCGHSPKCTVCVQGTHTHTAVKLRAAAVSLQLLHPIKMNGIVCPHTGVRPCEQGLTIAYVKILTTVPAHICMS